MKKRPPKKVGTSITSFKTGGDIGLRNIRHPIIPKHVKKHVDEKMKLKIATEWSKEVHLRSFGEPEATWNEEKQDYDVDESAQVENEDKLKFVNQGAGRGYSAPVEKIVVSFPLLFREDRINLLRMYDMGMVKIFLKSKGIETEYVATETSNVLCQLIWLVLKDNLDFTRMKDLMTEYIKNNKIDLDKDFQDE